MTDTQTPFLVGGKPVNPLTDWVDSSIPPSPDKCREIFQMGFRAWGIYVAGATEYIWQLADVEILRSIGFEHFMPIAVAPLNLEGNPVGLARDAVQQCARLGISGVLALDTEKQEEWNPELDSWVNVFENLVRQYDWHPVIYRGAGYSGNAHPWIPGWPTTGVIGERPADPIAIGGGSARQWAGNVELAGATVDLDIAQVEFPFATASGVGYLSGWDGTSALIVERQSLSGSLDPLQGVILSGSPGSQSPAPPSDSIASELGLPTLFPGAAGRDVEALQTLANLRGASLRVNGSYDLATEDWVSRSFGTPDFQPDYWADLIRGI